jgi:hypothetical protein
MKSIKINVPFVKSMYNLKKQLLIIALINILDYKNKKASYLKKYYLMFIKWKMNMSFLIYSMLIFVIGMVLF